MFFVNDGRHVTLSAAEEPSQNMLGDFELNMSGLEEFDLVATPIHEYYAHCNYMYGPFGAHAGCTAARLGVMGTAF